MLLGLLAKAEYAQQSFSSDCGPATHLVLPALESLHKAWHTRSTKEEYLGFWPALEAGIKKIASYYKKTADSDAYIMAMHMLILYLQVATSLRVIVLDPVQKVNHICKYWGLGVYDDAMEHAEALVRPRYHN
jgi:hypothetical protein